MFKSWRNVKKKIKATFKLQFQATQVPRQKKPALIISLVPEDVGKTTFKLEKAAVQDGICSWDNPVYVTVILIKEPKSGKLHEKIYHFIVSSGSSKSGYLGEASIDFADFADETEPLSVSLPLKFANSGAVLHVTIQKMHGDFDPRKIEDNEDPILSKDRNLKNQLSNGYTDKNDGSFNEDQDSDIVLSEQDSSFRTSIGGNSSFKSTLRQDSMPPKGAVDAITPKTTCIVGQALIENLPRELQETSDESIEKLKTELSNLMRQSELSELELQTLRRQMTKESRRGQDLSRHVKELEEERDALKTESELELQSLRKQITKESRRGQDLSRHVKELEEERDALETESELELQSLRKQITKECRRGQDLSRHVKELEEERDALKTECEQLKRSNEGESLNQLRAENEDSRVQLEEVRRELSHQKELNTNLKSQLQKTQDSNAELILAVGDLDEMLDRKNVEISSLSSKLDEVQEKNCKCSKKEDTDQQAVLALEENTREDNELCLLKQRVIDLSDEIDVYRETREKLENYIEQLTQDSEDLKRENHDISSKLEQGKLQEHKTSECSATIKELESQVQRLEEKLKMQTKELSESLLFINELESQVKGLEKEREKQAQGYENDLDAMTHARVEQEQRAIRAEEALRKTKWKNAATAEQLQEEFRKLSVEMAGKFDENEKLTMESVVEANELRIQNRVLEENLKKSNEELAMMTDQNRVKIEELSMQLDLKTKHMEQMSVELEDASNKLKHGGEMQEAFLADVRMLKSEIETLKKEKNDISEVEKEVKLRDETEKLKTSSEETKIQTEIQKSERDEIEEIFALTKNEAENTRQELFNLKSLKDEKEAMIKNLSLELQSLRDLQIELKNSLSAEEQEKEKLQQQVLELKGKLQKKEQENTSFMKKLTFSDEKNSVPMDGRMQIKCAATNTANVNDFQKRNIGEDLLNSEMHTAGCKGIEREAKTCSKEELRVGTFHSMDEGYLIELLTEMAQLKERNKCMETELKEMQERYLEISLKLAEVEGERQQLVMTVRNLKNGKRH
ncbi:PREDICTED: LOW QUALITY PROTEIN: myosin heavy chain, striated muscle-like [Populus euphratica]|uniref:LOW QUALITY PROTEIN: myosin heavy chain, striated muscle-like n=1 Tax=Populus euphratica TaxID=75702 RepID=A0AAJ6TR38_POPEU|nr:PREDICTED: LOW QUALITY PROTEIN: myosin heavy chain, striated muscle-like [Populus euphratica]